MSGAPATRTSSLGPARRFWTTRSRAAGSIGLVGSCHPFSSMRSRGALPDNDIGRHDPNRQGYCSLAGSACRSSSRLLWRRERRSIVARSRSRLPISAIRIGFFVRHRLQLGALVGINFVGAEALGRATGVAGANLGDVLRSASGGSSVSRNWPWGVEMIRTGGVGFTIPTGAEFADGAETGCVASFSLFSGLPLR